MGHRRGFPVPYIHGHNTAKDGRAATRRTPEWTAYENAKQRCTNSKRKGWKNWGGRGIEFRFKSFAEFLAEIGKRPSPKLTVDRIDNDGHYEVGNVQWATREHQIKNRRKT